MKINFGCIDSKMEEFSNNITTCIFSLSENQKVYQTLISWYISGMGTLIIGTVGIFLNIVSIVVIMRSELKNSFFNWLLICLVICDSSFLLTCISEAFRKHIGSIPIHNYIFAVFVFPFRSMVMLSSIYLTIGLSIERYNALLNPISHQNYRGYEPARLCHQLSGPLWLALFFPALSF